MEAQLSALGEVRQISYVVADVDAAISSWLALGVGPWFVIRSLRVEGSRYRGVDADPLLALAFANSGELQIELIEPLDDTPSVYRECIDSGLAGFHHVAFWTRDFEGVEQLAEQAGWPTIQSGPVRFSYHTVPGPPELVIEVMEVNDKLEAITAAIREAAVSWDRSTDPVRPYPPQLR
jgi:Glyoxalase/Bleomycin resistance protein/Dioxygenase superfamily